MSKEENGIGIGDVIKYHDVYGIVIDLLPKTTTDIEIHAYWQDMRDKGHPVPAKYCELVYKKPQKETQ